jgi:tetratricopeptide (TPR) repeat protein
MQRLISTVVLAALLLCPAVPAKAQSERDYYNKGLELLRAGKHSEAISAFSTAIKLDDGHSDVYAERGRAYCELKNYDKAITDLNQALRLDPENVPALMNRGSAWDDKGDHDKAIVDYNQALRFDPNDAEIYYNRGMAWMNKGEYGKAIADYNQTVKLDPDEADAYNYIAWLQATCPDQSIRDGQKAVQNAKKAYQLNGGRKWYTLDTLAAAYAERGDFEKAKEWQAKAIKLAKADKTATDKKRAEANSHMELYMQGKPFHEEPKKK